MIKIRTLAAVLALSSLPVSAFAYEVLEACATYVGTGKSYEIDVNIYDGRELNERTSSYDYNSYDNYVVIFWSNDEASVIELDSSFCNTDFSCDGVDQRGYKWEIKTGFFFCR